MSSPKSPTVKDALQTNFEYEHALYTVVMEVC